MKNKLNLKNISIFLNIILFGVVLIIIVALFYLQILPPFSDTENTISDVPILDIDSLKVEPVVENLEIPWDIEFVGDDKMLITERTGTVQLAIDGELQPDPALDLTNEVVAIGEAGLMGMVKHPDFDENNLVYIYHTYRVGDTFLKISAYEFLDNKLVNEKLIFERIPTGSIHSGGQIEFGPDGMLYVTTGDVGDADLAQDLESLAGKTLRINPDSSGSLLKDNPFIRLVNGEIDKGFSNSWHVYSYGHRNAQGLDWHPVTWEMYQSEHGPSGFDGGTGMDEINIVKRGANLGWPEIMGEETHPQMYSPLLEYTPAIAPASGKFYDGTMFEELENMFMVGALRGTNILVFDVKGETATEKYRLLSEDYGRIRYVTVGPDGAIYFTTSNTDGRGNPSQNDDKVYKIYR